VDGYGIENALDGTLTADLTHLGLWVVHALEKLKHMPVGAPVLVNRHLRIEDSDGGG
jgi:hypothetical protein